MKLYGFAPTRTIRALWMLRELDLDFEYVQVDLTKGEHRRPEFLALNPAGKVPVLVDDDLVLSESVAIVLYLAEKYPQKGVPPRRPASPCGSESLAALHGDGARATALAHRAPGLPRHGRGHGEAPREPPCAGR